jgi:hypothetical protein
MGCPDATLRCPSDGTLNDENARIFGGLRLELPPDMAWDGKERRKFEAKAQAATPPAATPKKDQKPTPR